MRHKTRDVRQETRELPLPSLISPLLSLNYYFMSKIKYFLAVFAMLLLMAACEPKTDEGQPDTPRDELIIGTWNFHNTPYA